MFTSWANGLLQSFFKRGADAKPNTKALMKQMEQSFGEIKIVPLVGNKMFVFFEKQTLVGDANLRRSMRIKNTIINLDRKEATGAGRTADDAILALWDKMTLLKPDENILQFEGDIHDLEGHYTSFTFKKGQFVNQGKTWNELPPTRPTIIETFLANERRPRMLAISLAPSPIGAKN